MAGLLDVQGLTKSFGGLTAVKGLTFSVREREIVGFIGPNGSGKTTAFNLITGLLTPDGGAVRLSVQHNPTKILLGVADNGPGIPRDEWDQIFDRFSQLPIQNAGEA